MLDNLLKGLTDPIMDMFAIQSLRERFETAVEHNLVMDFDEYADRFGSEPGKPAKEDLINLPCEPFVYVPWTLGWSRDIVADSVIDGEHRVLSVYGEHSFWGVPQLMIHHPDKDDTVHDGDWLCMYIIYHSNLCTDDFSIISRIAYVNPVTGEHRW